MAVSVDQFGKALVASGLLSADDVKTLWAEFPADARPKDGEAFSKRLVEQGKLTDFQAKQIAAGRGAALVMGEYVVLQEIGAGGMGQVYKAQHRRMKRIVALKVMSSAAMKDEASVKRFQREVEAAARLEHPNIVTAYDAGRAGNVAFLVMQFVDGGDLSSLVKKHGPLPIEQACDYVRQAACGLAYAHGEGVIHRDIKPANLLCDKKGVVKILDMGLARIEKGDDGLTGTEQVMGTVDYMSPEQASSTKTADARSDVYSLGCTLWYLLTARKAYEGESLIERLMAHREQPLPSLVKARDDAPWSLEQVLHKMLAKRAADRYQTMDEVVEALQPFAPAGSGSSVGRGSSIGMGSGPHDADLSAFFKTVGPGGAKTPTKTANVTAAPPAKHLAVGLAPPSAAKPQAKIPAAKSAPPVKLIAGGTAAAVLLIAGIVYVTQSVEESNPGEPGASATGAVAATTKPPVAPLTQLPPTQTPVAHAPSSPQTVPPTAAPISFLTPTPALPVVPPPPGDYALLFDGNGIVKFDEPLPYSIDGCTIEAYVRPDAIVKRAIVYAPSDRGELGIDPTEGKFWSIRHHQDAARFQAGHFAAQSRFPPELGRRVHLAGIYDKDEFRLYVDGKQLDKSTSKRDRAFTLGTRMSRIGSFFQGVIDEVRVSKSVRYAAEFTPPTRHEPDADTLALYHFDEGIGGELKDSSGNNRHGRIEGAKWVRPDGSPIPPPVAAPAPPPPGDYAMLFDGNGVVEFDAPLPYAVDSFTIEAYVRPDAAVVRAVVCSLSERGELGFDHGEGKEWSIRHAQLPSEKSKVGGHYSASGRMPAEIGKRVHLAGVGSNARFELFLDGKSIGRTPPMEGRVFSFGKRPPNIGSMFKGVIDEVRVSKSVRYTADFTPPVRHEPDADTLALYHCDEGVGGVLKDSSSNNRHGRIVSAKWVRSDGSPIPPPVAAATPAVSPPGVVYLDDLPEKSWRGYGVLGKHGRYLNNAPVNRGGKPVEHSLFTSPEVDEGFVEYDLPPGHASFRAVVYLLRTPSSPQTFQVVGDGKVLWKSEPQTTPNSELDVNADVRNVTVLRLEVLGIASNSHPVWVDPRLIPTAAAATSATVTPPAVPTAATQLVRYPTDQWVEILPLIDPAKDKLDLPNLTAKNDWQLVNGELVFKSDGRNGKLLFPVRYTKPTIEWGIEFTRTTGTRNFNSDAPAVGGVVPIMTDERSNGDVLLGGANARIGTGAKIETGKRAKLHFFSTTDGSQHRLQVVFEGRPVGEWSGNIVEMIKKTADEGFNPAERNGIWVHAGSDYIFHRVRVRGLQGAEVETIRPVAGSTTSPEAAVSVSSTIDLLAAVDPARDVIAGTWSKQNGALVAPQEGAGINNARIKLPTPGPVPPEYDVEFVVERTGDGGHGMVFGFVMGGRQAVLHMDSYSNPPLWGISDIDGKGGRDNAARNPGARLILGQRQRIHIWVRANRVRALCDGAPIVDWQGRPEQLSNGFWAVPDAQSLFLGSQSPFLVHAIRLTPKTP